jgi:hypothetical protein
MPALLAELQALEVELHHPGVRCSAARLEHLLHPAFHEVGRSGRPYDRSTVLRFLSEQTKQPDVQSTGFDVALLAPGCALLTYRSSQVQADGTPTNPTLRSSLWLRTEEGWQLRYHQGTPAELAPEASNDDALNDEDDDATVPDGTRLRIPLAELVDAYEWASAGGAYDSAAYIDRATGRTWLVTDMDDVGEEPPEDIDDESLYLPVPNQHELDLGRALALRFAQEHLPQRFEQVGDYFRKSGAFGRFKSLLDGAGQLDAWHAYEAKGVEDALRTWADANGIEVVVDRDAPV